MKEGRIFFMVIDPQKVLSSETTLVVPPMTFDLTDADAVADNNDDNKDDDDDDCDVASATLALSPLHSVELIKNYCRSDKGTQKVEVLSQENKRFVSKMIACFRLEVSKKI